MNGGVFWALFVLLAVVMWLGIIALLFTAAGCTAEFPC